MCVCVSVRVCVFAYPQLVLNKSYGLAILVSARRKVGRGRRRRGRMGTLTNVVCNNTVYTVWEGPPDVVGTFLVPGSNAR